MLRVRFHGRGGHGVKTASRILGTAAFLSGREAQDSPVYGPERRGAAVAAYTRVDQAPICERGWIADPDLILVADETLLNDPAAGLLLGSDGASALFVSSQRDGQDVVAHFGIRCPVLTSDLTALSLDLLGYGAALSAALGRWRSSIGNTGFQMSSASPFGSRTTTSLPAGGQAIGTAQHKKDIFEVWRAHRPPYVATLPTAEPVDLAEKVRRAVRSRGPKLFTAFATCPTGWGYDPGQGYHVAKLALDTGVWPLKEAVGGEVRHTYVPDRRRPVEDYLRTQRRFHHLFAPRRQDEAIHRIQVGIDSYWADVRRRELIHPGGPPGEARGQTVSY